VAAGTLGYVKAMWLRDKLMDGSAEEQECGRRVWPNLKVNNIIPDMIAALPGYKWKKRIRTRRARARIGTRRARAHPHTSRTTRASARASPRIRTRIGTHPLTSASVA
jgi:hypothetical protein